MWNLWHVYLRNIFSSEGESSGGAVDWFEYNDTWHGQGGGGGDIGAGFTWSSGGGDGGFGGGHYGTMGSGYNDTGVFTTSDVKRSLWNATPNNGYHTYTNVNGDWYHTSTTYIHNYEVFKNNASSILKSINCGLPESAIHEIPPKQLSVQFSFSLVLNTNIDKIKIAVNIINFRAIHPPPFGHSQFGPYVFFSLTSVGFVHSISAPGGAKDPGGSLFKMGFRIVNTDNGYNPSFGDIAILQGWRNNIQGHIEIYNGKEWVSDYFQGQNFFPWKGCSDATDKPSFKIYRYGN